jgi:exodeoxyribonuclease VII small subunit
MANKSPSAKPTEENFETAMARLEAIVTEMESDKLPLEDLLTRYEEGVKLVKVCEEKLAAAEKRIEIITRNAAGEPQIEEFEPAKKSPPSAGPDVSLF